MWKFKKVFKKTKKKNKKTDPNNLYYIDILIDIVIEHEEYFVFGINSKWEINDGDKKINYFEKVNINLFKAVLICDIDNKKIFPIRQHQKLIVLNNNFPKTDNFNIKWDG